MSSTLTSDCKEYNTFSAAISVKRKTTDAKNREHDNFDKTCFASQRIVELEGLPFVLQKEVHVSVIQSPVSIHRILNVWDISRPALIALGFDVKIGDVQPSCGKWTESQVECVVNADLFPSKDSYQIHINSDRIRISAGSLRGLHFALCTFTQLLQLSAMEPGSHDLVPMLIQDHPGVRHRAVLLDMSPQGRVLTLDICDLTLSTRTAEPLPVPHGQFTPTFLVRCHNGFIYREPPLPPSML